MTTSNSLEDSMDSRKIALHETGIIAIGEAVCVAAMLAVY